MIFKNLHTSMTTTDVAFASVKDTLKRFKISVYVDKSF